MTTGIKLHARIRRLALNAGWTLPVLAIAFQASCGDATAPTATPVRNTEVSTVILDRAGDSLLLRGARTTSFSQAPTGEVTVASSSEIVDQVAIARLRADMMAQLSGNAAGRALSRGGVEGPTADGRGGASRMEWQVVPMPETTTGGRKVRVDIVRKRGMNGPALASLTYVEGRLALVSEMQHEKVNGRSQLRRMRTTLFDATGKATTVFDSKFTPPEDRARAAMIGTLGARALAIIPQIARLVEPDVLYAQGTEVDADAKCKPELLGFVVASGMAGAQALKITATRALLTVAELALAEACPLLLPACVAAAPALVAALAAAEAAWMSEFVTGVTYATAAGIAAAIYYDCMRAVTEVGGFGYAGGEGDGPEYSVIPPQIRTSCYVFVEYDNQGYITSVSDPFGCLS